MFYIANAAILNLGYKIGDKMAHKITNDTLLVLVLNKLKKELLEEYETLKEDALQIVSIKTETIIENYELELGKRSRFQYNMLEETKENKAKTSLKRAQEFIFEIKKLIEA